MICADVPMDLEDSHESQLSTWAEAARADKGSCTCLYARKSIGPALPLLERLRDKERVLGQGKLPFWVIRQIPSTNHIWGSRGGLLPT